MTKFTNFEVINHLEIFILTFIIDKIKMDRNEIWGKFHYSEYSTSSKQLFAEEKFILNLIEGKYETDIALKSKQFKSFSKKLWSEGIWELSDAWFGSQLRLSWCSQNQHTASLSRILGGKIQYNSLSYKFNFLYIILNFIIPLI